MGTLTRLMKMPCIRWRSLSVLCSVVFCSQGQNFVDSMLCRPRSNTGPSRPRPQTLEVMMAKATSLEAKVSPTCAALPSIHAFTGSDFTSSFVRCGKIRPLQLVKKDPEYVNGNSDQVDENAMHKMEKFVCSMQCCIL